MGSSTNYQPPLSNEQLATVLEEVADLLEAQGANPFRVRAYRGAVQTLRQLTTPAHDILKDEGVAGLIKLPGIGQSLANAMNHLVWSHRLPLLERLRGEHAPERMFSTAPDIGKGLARRIHDHHNVSSLMWRERLLARRHVTQARPQAIRPWDTQHRPGRTIAPSQREVA